MIVNALLNDHHVCDHGDGHDHDGDDHDHDGDHGGGDHDYDVHDLKFNIFKLS